MSKLYYDIYIMTLLAIITYLLVRSEFFQSLRSLRSGPIPRNRKNLYYGIAAHLGIYLGIGVLLLLLGEDSYIKTATLVYSFSA